MLSFSVGKTKTDYYLHTGWLILIVGGVSPIVLSLVFLIILLPFAITSIFSIIAGALLIKHNQVGIYLGVLSVLMLSGALYYANASVYSHVFTLIMLYFLFLAHNGKQTGPSVSVSLK